KLHNDSDSSLFGNVFVNRELSNPTVYVGAKPVRPEPK
ncbi:MAG: hypothetical protein ACI9HA_003828, partial [Dinoroseobacter sp.]